MLGVLQAAQFNLIIAYTHCKGRLCVDSGSDHHSTIIDSEG